MDIRPIRNEDDLTWALDAIAPFFEAPPEPGTPDADRFDVLTILIEAYENRYHAIPAATPLAVLRFAVTDLGHTQSELATLLGSRSRASEVLAGKRRLTVDTILAISEAWHIPVAALLSSERDAKAA